MSTPFKIPVSPNQFALVDQGDVAMVMRYRWHITVAAKNRVHIYGKRRGFYKSPGVNLARLITGARGAETVTFKNKNQLDCRRENLEVVDLRKNIGKVVQRKSYTRPGKSSKYVGVSKSKGSGRVETRWRAYIRVSGHFIYLGRYATEDEAARAYDVAAVENFGSSAKVNFPRS